MGARRPDLHTLGTQLVVLMEPIELAVVSVSERRLLPRRSLPLRRSLRSFLLHSRRNGSASRHWSRLYYGGPRP